MRRSLYITSVILTLAIVENSNIVCNAQQVLNLSELAEEALNSNANEAATYLLYSEYLKSPDTFSKHEITAYLLVNIEEFAKAEDILSCLEEKRNIDELSDSLQFYYYTSKAGIAYDNVNYIKAIRFLAKLPDQKRKTRLLADSYKELGLFEKALEIYPVLFETEDSSYVHSLIAECYREMGLYDEAIKHYDEAKAYNKDWAIPYYGSGWSYELMGDDNMALKEYNEGLSVDRSYAYLFLLRGETYKRMGENELAEKDFESVLFLDKRIEEGSCRQYALYFLGRYDDAMNWMNLIIDSKPNDPGYYYDKACLCCRMGLLHDAIESIDVMFQKGYRKFAHLNADDDIDPIRNMPEYIELYNKYYAIYQNELEQLKDIL